MPIDPSIPLQAQAPSFDTTMKPIASMLGMASAAQQLQGHQLQNQQLGAQVQERQNLSKIDWNQFRDKDGNLDAVGASNAAMQAAPAFYGPVIAKQMNELAKDQTTIKTGLQNLNQSQRADIGAGLGALSMDPQLTPDKVVNWAQQYSEQNPNAAPLLMTALKHAPGDPNQLKQWLITNRNAVVAPGSQGSSLSQVSDGASTHFVQSNPLQPGTVQEVGQPVQNQVSPMQREEIQTDALGNRFIVERGPNGAILGTRQVPGSYNALGGSAPPTGPAYVPPGGSGQITDLSNEVTGARAIANQAPVLHDLNRSIIGEIDKGTITGSLGKYVNKLASSTGYSIGSEDGANYNTLGKLLERSALTAAQGMGPHTNAGLDAQVRANGSLDYSPQAIRKIAILNDALTTGGAHYNTGLSLATASGVGGKAKFDQQWAANFDPRIMRLENAQQNGDKGEIDAVMKEIGGPKSAAAAKLRQQAQNLQALINQGHL